ncbi:ABC transporter substrate-binding protein [Lysinibacter sp. HNR]|uniref:ABC transporter substrate-binding protein n=1 Tax=Lysinibacter sp. HNR TaxID=3031408 RepID=UPI002435A4D9|nr:ABC transporter substrate-binding protein [Lysinibacter sp. HNR]WGD37293.1 ABC transporter substrate-binding protein [Lysinibacter sp. HNR]
MVLGKKSSLVALGAAALLVLGACSSNGGDGGGASGNTTLTLGSLLEPVSLDPSQAQEGHRMPFYQAVYDTLIQRLPNGDLEPMLATEWEYNEDRTVLTLTLRDDVTFSDGEKFNAAAAQANLERFRTGNGPQGHTLDAVTSVEAHGDTTLTITLDAPDPALLSYLSNAAGLMASPAVIGTEGVKTNPVGSGPYTLDKSSTVVGSQYTYIKSKDYWQPELQQYDKIIIKPIPDVTARYNALVSGQVDVALLDSKTAAQAEGAGFVPHTAQVDWQGFIIHDREGQIVPALADVRVRQAINHAVDGGAILQEIQKGRGTSTGQVFGPGATAYDEALNSTYSYDPQKARALMSEAGYASGFSVSFPTASVADPALTAVMVEQMAAVDITLNLVEVPINEYISEVTSGKYPIVWMQLFQPSTWVNINQLIAPKALFNALSTSDPEVSRLIDEIRDASEEESVPLAQELNQYLVDQAWFAPWYRVDALVYSKDTVKVETQVEQVVPSIYNYSPAK